MLREQIELFYSSDLHSINRQEALQAFNELKFFLNNGEIRSAVPSENGWVVNEWVKKGILLGFRLGELTDVSLDDRFHFYDKNTYPLKKFSLGHQVRIVPGGSSVRDGSYVAKGVVIMPPSYINTGAYVDEGTMIDSHALIGSCAQIGKHIHLSAGTQIGGVLEPIGAMPVIVEDDVFIGANCGIFEGTTIKKRAVLASGVLLTASTPIYDVVHTAVYRSTKERPLIVPEGAVVVPGSRRIENNFAQNNGLSVYTPIIIKYRDAGTDAATVLEESLR